MTTLLLDIGNSRIKWGVHDGGGISRSGQLSRQQFHDDGPGTLTHRLPRKIDKVLASNVAGPSFATRLTGILTAACNCDVHFVKTTREACGVTNSYRQPRRMGVDRWLAMIGAYCEFHSALLVIDAGTAVTIDAVDRGGQHLGGQILPGITLMAETLASNTSAIPMVQSRTTRRSDGLEMFASTTAGAVSKGALNAVIGAIERAGKAMRSARHRPSIVLTGGDASRILKVLGDQPVYRPHLVLQGLAEMLDSHL